MKPLRQHRLNVSPRCRYSTRVRLFSCPRKPLGLMAPLGALVFLAACGVSPTTSSISTPVSQSEALQAMGNFWNTREQALIAGDGSAFTNLYTGPGLDLAKIDFAAKRNDWPGKYPRPFAGGNNDVYLPTSSTSPLWFIGNINAFEINQDGTSLNFSKSHGYFLFTRVSDAWKVYFPVGVSLTSFPPPGFAVFGSPAPLTLPALAAPATYLVDPSQIGAAYLTHINAVTAGQPSSQPFSSDVPSTLAPPSYGGATIQVTYSAYPNVPTFSYVDPHGNAIVFFAVSRSLSVKMPAKTCLYKAGYAYSTSSLPNLIPAGRYSGYTSTDLALVAATIPQKSSNPAVGRQVVTFSATGDVVAATSQPAIAGSTCYIPT